MSRAAFVVISGSKGRRLACLTTVLLTACAHRTPAPEAAPTVSIAMPAPLAVARQLVVVTTPEWNATSGAMRRYERDGAGAAWRAVGAEVPIVVGRTGVAWDPGLRLAAAGEPQKREGDGKSPAGAFPLDTTFGFAEPAPAVRLPYVALQPGSDCVDDIASAHYNTVVDRATVGRVDWASAEHMRTIAQYRLGVIVGYNAAPPRRGLGSCIFLHIWAGPGSTTAGCTAMDAGALAETMAWLDPARRPTLVQLPSAAYGRLRGAWGLP
jgi:L,D-peptidoglycan transpeptidase YkuD (ErfK/YbiS/YcfS/YnhG family)